MTPSQITELNRRKALIRRLMRHDRVQMRLELVKAEVNARLNVAPNQATISLCAELEDIIQSQIMEHVADSIADEALRAQLDRALDILSQ